MQILIHFDEKVHDAHLLKDLIKNSEFRSQNSGVRSQESGVRSQESGVRSQESEVRINE
ncbi:hypothetical protein [Nostoc sp.]|uniref:hypothetical protein n=1 Tax=Nostoc sp. TaxID=1180 RepID=UPI002FF500BC